MSRRGDAAGRLLLEGVDHPDVIIQLERVDQPVGVPALLDGQFPDARTEAVQRLGNFGRVSFGNLRQPSRGLLLGEQWEGLEVLQMRP